MSRGGYTLEPPGYRFCITEGRLGFWWWSASGHGVSNVSQGSSHLPRRSRAAVERAAREWADRQDAKRARVSEYRHAPPAAPSGGEHGGAGT